MNFFSGIALIFVLIMATVQFAPVVGDHYRAKEAAANAVVFKEQQHQQAIKNCAEGKASYIMYDGKTCKTN
jgi:hypothetical protein